MLSHFMPSQAIVSRMSAGLDAVVVIPTGQPTVKSHFWLRVTVAPQLLYVCQPRDMIEESRAVKYQARAGR